MSDGLSVVETVALTLGVGWASGINLYAAVFTLGLLSSGGYAVLPPELALLSEPSVIFVAGFLFFVEFFADKIPGVDSIWDGVHTFIRIPAAAILAAGAAGQVAPEAQFVAGLVGGTLGATSHATKAGSRLLINTSPEPFSNIVASLGEDLLVIGGLWTALHHPTVFLFMLGIFVVIAVFALPRLWGVFRRVFRSVLSLFRRRKVMPTATVQGGPTT